MRVKVNVHGVLACDSNCGIVIGAAYVYTKPRIIN
jgi:hypothetical protein